MIVILPGIHSLTLGISHLMNESYEKNYKYIFLLLCIAVAVLCANVESQKSPPGETAVLERQCKYTLLLCGLI